MIIGGSSQRAKPRFTVDIAEGAQSSLEAQLWLASTSDEGCHHISRGLRQPLGIYNASVSRVFDKITRLCARLETYFRAQGTLEPNAKNDDVMQEVVDYVELSIYAAAEHVDDLQSIADGYFRHVAQRDKHFAYRTLVKALKQHKRLVASVANAIKHHQARVRVFSMEYQHDGYVGALHGYFVEGVENGVVCPSPAFHRDQQVFSLTTLVWEILAFVLQCSCDLRTFLEAVASQHSGPTRVAGDELSRAVVAAARLPLYTFGEQHPFDRITLELLSSGTPVQALESSLYGSIRTGWSLSSAASFGRFTSRFVGDGKTVQFRFALPKTVALQHWD